MGIVKCKNETVYCRPVARVFLKGGSKIKGGLGATENFAN